MLRMRRARGGGHQKFRISGVNMNYARMSYIEIWSRGQSRADSISTMRFLEKREKAFFETPQIM